MKYIYASTINGIFLFLTIGLLIYNLMYDYVANIGSFPLIFFIGFVFTIIALFIYYILILSENSELLIRNNEIKQNNNNTLRNNDRRLIDIIDIVLFILHSAYIIPVIYVSIRLDIISYMLIQYILFIASLILLRKTLNRNIKLRRLLRNNETISKHLRPL